MTHRSLRSLSSMRARMTAGFVFVLAPFLLVMSAILPRFTNRFTELQQQGRVGWLAERVSQRMSGPNWRGRLAELMATKLPQQDHLALLVFARDGSLVWRSPGPGPAWSPEVGTIWRKVMGRVQASSKSATLLKLQREAGAWFVAEMGPMSRSQGVEGIVVRGPNRSERLGLTSAQKAAIENVMKASKEQAAAADGSAAKLGTIKQSTWQRIMAVLTREQQQKLATAKRFEIENLPAAFKAQDPTVARLAAETKESVEAKVLAEGKVAGMLPVLPGKSGDDWRAVDEYPVGPESRRLALVIFQSWSAVTQERAVQKLELLLLSLFAVLGVAGGAWLLVGRTLSPIHRLAVQASVASVEDLQVRLKAPSRDAEVVDLVGTLNGLLERLAETAAAKGRFYAAASHELRTPLQALSGHLEVALSRGRTTGEYETFLQEAYRQTGRLTSLVQDLLLLHQLDSAAPQVQEPVDLAGVCDGVLGQLGPLIDARHLRLSAHLAPGTEILASPSHAEILVRNLAENAVKYASTGGEVSLRLAAGSEGARLEVFNECPPVPGWDPEKLFEPFYRPDSARNTRTGGNGLGLAICRAIAAANGWTVTLQQGPEGVRATAAFGLRSVAREAGPGGPVG